MIRQPLRARSLKRERLNIAYRHLVARLLEERPACEAQLPGCTGRSTDAHHLLSRARGGALLDMGNLAALCSLCHRKITVHATGTAAWRLPSWSRRPGGAA